MTVVSVALFVITLLVVALCVALSGRGSSRRGGTLRFDSAEVRAVFKHARDTRVFDDLDALTAAAPSPSRGYRITERLAQQIEDEALRIGPFPVVIDPEQPRRTVSIRNRHGETIGEMQVPDA